MPGKAPFSGGVRSVAGEFAQAVREAAVGSAQQAVVVLVGQAVDLFAQAADGDHSVGAGAGAVTGEVLQRLDQRRPLADVQVVALRVGQGVLDPSPPGVRFLQLSIGEVLEVQAVGGRAVVGARGEPPPDRALSGWLAR